MLNNTNINNKNITNAILSGSIIVTSSGSDSDHINPGGAFKAQGMLLAKTVNVNTKEGGGISAS
jgi:hypothetical protein